MAPTDYGRKGVKSFVVHPGARLSGELKEWLPHGAEVNVLMPEFSAWTYVRLTSGSEDWMSGRYVDATRSLDELEKIKEKVIQQYAFKNRLALPV